MEQFVIRSRYEFCYAKRPNKTDCAIIAWKKDKFELINGASLCYDDLADAAKQYVENAAEIKDGDPGDDIGDVEDTFRKNNVAAMVALRAKNSDSDAGVVVGSTHLYFNPAMANVKLSQAQMLKEAIGYFALKHKFPVVLCSDLNSQPTGVAYSVLISPTDPMCDASETMPVGWAKSLHYQRADTDESELVQEFVPSEEDYDHWLKHLQKVLHVGTKQSLLVRRDASDCWDHKLFTKTKEGDRKTEPWAFKSSYLEAARNSRWIEDDSGELLCSNINHETLEPEATTFTAEFSGCIDYIFYRGNVPSSAGEKAPNATDSSPHLSLIGCWPLPTKEEACAGHQSLALPNSTHPSDHLPLTAKFSLHECA